MKTQSIHIIAVAVCTFPFFTQLSYAAEEIVVSTGEPASSEWSSVSFSSPVGSDDHSAHISASNTDHGRLGHLSVVFGDTTYTLSKEILAQFSHVQLRSMMLFYSRESVNSPTWSMHVVFDFGKPDESLPFYDCNVQAGRSKRYSTAFVGIGVGAAADDWLTVYNYDGSQTNETALSIWETSSD